ncbi:ketopantoate reductase family protein [Marinomonas balearica]|uniref:2-dehydropantoate 2-reductase n=1 Tax=Marinomonas balearica TaxID=491947 RepID=A0A4R6M6B9_9GAMM|nr:2-dehydropantoate 2-reductase [Marinomonas balearica]TDO96824.1 ketopantoate reductase [Marinomonas balearica]
MTQHTCLIIGAGAIGLLWATKLANRNINTHLLYRTSNPGNHINLDSDLEEDFKPTSEITTLNIETISQKYDNVLICTKSFDMVSAYLSVKEFTKKSANIWTLCNGMGMHDELIPHLKKNQSLWSGVTSEGAYKLNKNTVKQTGMGDTFFGLYYSPTAESHENPEENTQTTHSLFQDFLVPNITQRMLEKLAVNCIINPVSALFEIRNGEVLEEPYKSLTERCVHELAECYQAEPLQHMISNPANFSFFNLVNRVYTVAQLTRLNHSSMHEDLKFERKTEIENICGYIIEHSKKTPPLISLLNRAICCPNEREQHKKALLESC